MSLATVAAVATVGLVAIGVGYLIYKWIKR
jgi:xanthosine utilization system XapX-like protein